MKTCSRCGKRKMLAEFYVNSHYAGGYTRRCKPCVVAAAQEWGQQNPERRRQVRLGWNARNLEQKRQSSSALRLRKIADLGREAVLEQERAQSKRWRVLNPTAVRRATNRAYRKRCDERPEAEKARRAIGKAQMMKHPIRSIAYRLSATVRSAIKRRATTKKFRTVELTGCTIPEFMAHIEQQWLPSMTWANWGRRGWHLDHIRPIISFDLADPAQQRACFHFSNYQPLWAIDNIRKGARWEG